MASTLNYDWAIPDVGGSNGAWGGILNALFVAADASLKAIENLATAALPKAGGVMTGRLDLLNMSQARKDMGNVSGATNFDLSQGQYFTMTVVGALTPNFISIAGGSVVQGVVWRITNGGAFGVVWPASFKWASGVAPSLTVAGTDLLGFITDDNSGTWRGVVIAKDVR